MSDELDRIRAGADPTPPAEGQSLSAGQVWHWLLEADPDRRIKRLEQLITAAANGGACFVLDHEGRIEPLEWRLTRKLLAEFVDAT